MFIAQDRTVILQACYHRPMLREVTEVGCPDCGEVLAHATLRGGDVTKANALRDAWALAVVEPGAEQRALRSIVKEMA